MTTPLENDHNHSQSAEYLIFLLLGKHLRRLYWTLVKLDVTGGTRGQRLRLWPWT